MTADHSQVLFLCTGNYYRSRFAEYLFNHYVADYSLPWRAFSRGLAIELLKDNAGPISLHTLQELEARNIPIGEIRAPISVSEQDLLAAQHIIALKQAEHHPLMCKNFPEWAGRIEYWHVHDVEDEHPEQALPQIERAVRELLECLSNQLLIQNSGE